MSLSMKRELIANLRTLPNQMTAIRLLLLPCLWLFALLDLNMFLGIGLVVAFATDILDGFIARRMNQSTDFGAKFDSLADNLLAPSAIAWMLLLKPDLFVSHTILLSIAITIYISSLTIGWLKFRRFGNLHLYSSKIAGVLLYLFAIHLFLGRDYNRMFFLAATIAFMISSTETLLLQLTSENVDQHIGSLFHIRKHGRSS